MFDFIIDFCWLPLVIRVHGTADFTHHYCMFSVLLLSQLF